MIVPQARREPAGSLPLRLTLVTGLMVIVVTLLLYLVLRQHEFELILSETGVSLRSDLDTRAHLLKAQLTHLGDANRFLANTPPVPGIARARLAGGTDPRDGSTLAEWQSRLRQIFVGFAEGDPAIRQVRLIARDGQELVRVDRDGAFVRAIEGADLQNKADRPYFRQAMTMPAGSLHIGAIELNREHGQLSEPHWATVRAATPVSGEDGSPLGIVVVNYAVEDWLQPLRQIHTREAMLHIANTAGDFILHPDSHRVLSVELGDPYRLSDAFPGLDPDAGPSALQPIADAQGGGYAVASRVALDPDTLGGAVVLVATIPLAPLQARLAEHMDAMLPPMLGGGLLVFVIASLMLRQQLKPLADVVRMARQVAAGNYRIEIPAHPGRGEITTLIEVFEAMIDNLHRRQQESDRLQTELRNSEAFSKAIIRSSPSGVLVINDAGLIVRSNAAADQMFGYDTEALIGQPVDGLVPISSRDYHAVQRAGYRSIDPPRLMGQRGQSFTGQRADGLCFPAEIALANLVTAEGRFVVATVNDVTEQRERRAHAEMLASIVENSGDFICICTPTLEPIYLNQAACRLLGVKAEAAGAHRLTDFFDEGDRQRLSGEVVRALRTDGQWSGEMRVRHIDTGECTETLWNAFAIGDDKGGSRAWAVIAPDLSERRARITAEAASDAKTTFLAHMSHEIRTPLNAVISVAYLLSRAGLDKDQEHLVGQLRQAGQQLAALINDVLDLSKIESGKLEIDRTEFLLTDLVRDMAGLMSHQAVEKGLDLRLDLSPELPDAVLGDPTRLNQVLANLLSNAIKFTEKGQVGLSVQVVEHDGRQVTVEFRVSDTGIGIDMAAVDRLFAPFSQADASTTRRFGGTGLGLAICKRLVESMGGRIEVSSRPGVGSEFRFRLGFARTGGPVARKAGPVPRAAEPSGSRRQALAGVRILVVDDSDINRDIARRLLRLEGASVSLAVHGQDAVDLLTGKDNPVDLVLMDLQMPVLDGFAATRRIREEAALADLPVVALTAAALPAERARGVAAGMDDFITKPIDPAHMVEVILEQLARRGRRPAAAAGGDRPAPVDVADEWPLIPGLATGETRARMGGDVRLLRSLMQRMFDEFSDLGDIASDAPRATPGGTLQRVHKLRGIAGNIGAARICQLASELEDALRRGEETTPGPLAERLHGEMMALLEASRDFLAQRDDPVVRGGDKLDGQGLARLAEALAGNDLSALDQFEKLAPELGAHLDAALLERLRRAIEGLQFDEARRLLQPLLADAGTTTR